MTPDFILTKINRLESWLDSSKISLINLPLKLGGYLLLIVFLMMSNLAALIRWPFAAARRFFSSSSSFLVTNGEPVDADEEILQSAISSGDRVLVDFWAEWCGPCVMMNGSIKKLAKEQSDDITVMKVNTVTHPRLAKDHYVKGLPTLILFENGEEVDRFAGALSYHELASLVSKEKV
jgi:thioredoxin